MLDYSSLFFIQFFLGGVNLPSDCAGLSQGWLGEFCVMSGAHLFVLSNILQAGLELAAVVVVVVVAVASTKFSQCNQLWGSFPQG
jgi:hypothetical protein